MPVLHRRDSNSPSWWVIWINISRTCDCCLHFKCVLNKNIDETWNNLKNVTELQFIQGNQSIEINELGPNLWISHDWEYRFAAVGHIYLKKLTSQWASGTRQCILCNQITINKMKLCSLSVAYACPYHNSTVLTSANRLPTRRHTHGLWLWVRLDLLPNCLKQRW